jgi:hypothetical protein
LSNGEDNTVMPKFGILVARDDYGYFSYTLIIDHKIVKVATPFMTALAAFRAACAEANLRGHLRAGE